MVSHKKSLTFSNTKGGSRPVQALPIELHPGFDERREVSPSPQGGPPSDPSCFDLGLDPNPQPLVC